jgi:LmbE family N-acetylglucosaminyl deacetylase
MKCYTLAALVLATSVSIYAETPFDSSIKPSLVPFEIAPNRGSVGLWQSLKKLHTRGSLIMITAHPDDEDGPTLAYESRGAGARVTLLTLNRGEGGANVMSSDYWDALGLVRTQELLAAGQYYGVDQYWTRVCDYGFSKTMDEALAKWQRESLLAEVVRVIRLTRPLVVTSVFVGGPSDGHGNHQVAGLMAKEAFEAAGDSNRFPEQIREGLRAWKPLKYYAHTPWFQREHDIAKTLDVPVGNYDALLGESYLQLSRRGLGLQKSQNGGTGMPAAGPLPSPYHRFASLIPARDQEQGFFDGIDTSLLAIGPPSGFVKEQLTKINAAVEEAIAKFSAVSPDECAPALARGLQATESLVADVQTSSLSEEAKYDILHELNIKRAQFNTALVESLGISLRATTMPDDEVNPLFALFMGDPDTFQMAIPGQHFRVSVSVRSQGSAQVAISRVYLNSPRPNWWTIAKRKEEGGQWQFAVTAAESIPYTRPYFSRPSIEQPYYDLEAAAPLGEPLNPYPLNAWGEVSYRGVQIKIGQVVQTTHRETGPGVVFQPLTVGPAISVQVSPHAGVVPLSAKSFDLTVTLHSNVKGPAQGVVTLQLPTDWKSNPPDEGFATEKDGDEQLLHFRVIPGSLSERSYEIAAIAKFNGREYREGYQVTGYQGLRPYFLYRPATYKTTGVDATVAPNLKIAYVVGSGDDVPAALEQLGIKVTSLTALDLATGDLSHFDTILLGVRAYAARPDLVKNNQRLLEYVKNGGVAIVQYNTPEFDHNYGPYPYKMGDNPEEVTDEQSQVKILAPTNPLLNWPNKITDTDFKGWIEERGSKFMSTWDPHYQPLLETHDPGQAPQQGGLLYARYGKGAYVYDAYAFYRELPEGVPGAFRLMANLLSLPKSLARKE